MSAESEVAAGNFADEAGKGFAGRRGVRAIRLAFSVLLVGFICHASTEIGFAHKFPPHYISPHWRGARIF